MHSLERIGPLLPLSFDHLSVRPRQTDGRTNVVAIARRFILTNVSRAQKIARIDANCFYHHCVAGYCINNNNSASQFMTMCIVADAETIQRSTSGLLRGHQRSICRGTGGWGGLTPHWLKMTPSVVTENFWLGVRLRSPSPDPARPT